MNHRHLNHEEYTLAAIDDVIARGHRGDWEDLRDAIKKNLALLAKIRKICEVRISDPYAQRYHFWYHYEKAKRAS